MVDGVAAELTYRLIADSIGEVVCHVGDDGRFLFVSPSVEKVLQAPADHWIGRDVEDIIPPDDRASHGARVRRLAAGDVVKDRMRIIAADGSTHWVHMLATPFFDGDGRRNGVAATFREIDDAEMDALAAAAEARREQEKADERYRRSMDNAAVGMGLVTPDGRFDRVNTALCEFFGYNAEVLTGMSWHDLTVAHYVEADQKLVDDVLEGRVDSFRAFKHYRHADGHPIWADLSVSCVRDAEGRVEHLIAQIVDVTEQVRAQQQVAERDERNRALAEDLRRQTERLTRELESAAAYVSSILPKELNGGVAVASRYLPSRQLGGDSFNYAWIDDDHLMIYLLDVSGHGVRPALLSVSLHNVLRSGSLAADTLLTPEAVLAELNLLFQMDQQDDHYFTIWYGIYRASDRTLTYAGAGSPPALAFNATPDETVTTTALPAASPAVGILPDTVFSAASYVVPQGCRLLVYSDGICELDIGDGRQLRLADFVALCSEVAERPNWSLDDLVERLRSLTPEGAFEDDCSLIQITFD